MSNLYFNDANSQDSNYGNSSNWYTGSFNGSPAGRIPTSSDDLYFDGDYIGSNAELADWRRQIAIDSSNTAASVGCSNAYFQNSCGLLINLKCSGVASFIGLSSTAQNFSSSKVGKITGNATFNSGSVNYGQVTGNVTFYEITSIEGVAIDNSGSGYGVIGGYAYDSSGNSIIAWKFSNCSPFGFFGNSHITSVYFVNGSTFSQNVSLAEWGGTLNATNVYFYDTSSNVSGTILATNIYFYDYSVNKGNAGIATSNCYFYNNSLNSGTCYGSLFIESPNPNLNMGGCKNSYGDSIPSIYIGYGIVFYGGYSNNYTDVENWGTSNNTPLNRLPLATETILFPDNSPYSNVNKYNCTTDGTGWAESHGCKSAIVVNQNFVINLTCQSSISFLFNSVNSAAIFGDAIFKNNSKNEFSGTVSKSASFYDASYNSGIISESASFYDISYNSGTIQNDGFFYSRSKNLGLVSENGFFWDFSFNEGNVSGVVFSLGIYSLQTSINVKVSFEPQYVFSVKI